MISYWIGWSGFRISYWLLFGWRAYNRERVPLEGPVILAANHASFIDPPLVGIPLKRPLNYMARDTLFRFPGVGATLRSWQAIPVDRGGGGGAGLKAILDRLLKGGAILLFPEGTRTHDGKLQPGRSGIGLAVSLADLAVLTAITCSSCDRRKWRRWRSHPITAEDLLSVLLQKQLGR